MNSFSNQQGSIIVDNIIVAIQKNKQYLSDIDGAIGDGDHGINMNKGFTLCRTELDKNPGNMTHGLEILSKILLMKIGGSMGPLYGKFFEAFAETTREKENINADDFKDVLSNIQMTITKISTAKVGDKTLMDVFIPAATSYNQALFSGKDFKDALNDMKSAAKVGRDSTKEMTAKIGRASRLGERSRGTVDAGAASCYIILETIAETIINLT